MRQAGALAVALLWGCSGPHPGARPEDQSAAAHEREAAAHEDAAERHAAAFEPEQAARFPCLILGSRGARAQSSCWSEMENPTEEHLRLADLHRKLAEDHRRASEALREAEARACRGIPDSDRDMSPFQHPQDVASVERLVESGRLVGARVRFRPVRGLTVETLQAIVDCHVARNAVLGHEDRDPRGADRPDCPLVPRHLEAEVEGETSGLVVTIRSDDPASAADVWARAERVGAAAARAR